MSAAPRPNDEAINGFALICKIIASSLIGGVLAFAGVAIVLRLGKPPAAAGLISAIAAGFAVASVLIRQVLLGLLAARAGGSRGLGAAGPLAPYQTRMIIGLALLEGAAFFNLIAYLLEGRWWSLAVTAALVAFMLASYPTRGRIRQWVEDREQLKTFGPGEPR